MFSTCATFTFASWLLTEYHIYAQDSLVKSELAFCWVVRALDNNKVLNVHTF